MKKQYYISVAQMADLLGISRIAVYKKIKKGQIKAVRIGRNFAIPGKHLSNIVGKTLTDEDKKIIDKAVRKTFRDYGQVIKLLGKA